jgi:hypothetical protein
VGQLPDQVRLRPDAAGHQDLAEGLRHRDPAAGQLRHEPVEGIVPGPRLSAGGRRELPPENPEIAGQDRVIHINEERFRLGHTAIVTGCAHEPTLPEQLRSDN